MTPSWGQIRLAALAVIATAVLTAGVFVSVRNTEAIQHQRRDSIIADCQRDDMHYLAFVKKLHALVPNTPAAKIKPILELISTIVPYNKDCKALASSKVKS